MQKIIKYFSWIHLHFGLCSIIFYLALAVNISIGQNSYRSNGDTLAIVNKKVINSDDFIKYYKVKKDKYGLSDNLITRQGYLNNLIADEVLIEKAKFNKFHLTNESKLEKERIYTQELLNAYSDKCIINGIKITDKDLKEIYYRLNTKIKVRHLYSATKENADSLYHLLENGVDFSYLAGQVFTDRELKESGGSLGYIEMDEMDPDFENAAYSMKVGQISKPIKTVQGYSIILVEDIKSNPLTTESEFLKIKSKLKDFAYSRKSKEALKNYSYQQRLNYAIQFNNKLIDKLLNVITRNTIGELKELESNKFSSKELNTRIITSNRGSWSLVELFRQMRIIKEYQQKYIRTKENLEDFIAGLYIRDQIIKSAKKEKLDSSETFQNKVNYAFDSYLLSIIESEYKSKIKISEDSLKSFYNNNKQYFIIEPEIRLSTILLENDLIADSVKYLLNNNLPFEELARQYSIQKRTAKVGGDIGYYKRNELGNLADELFDLEVGKWIGPISESGKYLFIKCTDKKPVEYKLYKDVAKEINETLVSISWVERRNKIAAELKNEIPWTIYPEKLKTLTMH